MGRGFTKDGMSKLKLPEGKAQHDWYENVDHGRTLVFTRGKRTATWSLMYYENRKTKRRKIGSWPDMEPAVARKAAKQYVIAKAEDEAKEETFKQVAEKYLKANADAMITGREVRRQFQKYIYPEWADKPFASVRREQVSDLLDKVQADCAARMGDPKAGRGMRNAVYSTLRTMMVWVEARRENFVIPVTKGMLAKMPKPKTRWLADEEIRHVWAACEAEDENGLPKLDVNFSRIVRLLILLGQRRSKVGEMRWTDLRRNDDGLLVWTIPQEEDAKGVPPPITLPPMATELVDRQPRVAGNLHVFAGRGRAAFNSWGQRKRELDRMMPWGTKDWVLHDLRRTHRRLLTRAKIDTAVAELVLGHAIVGTQRLYDDIMEYQPFINEALVKVEDEVNSILTSA